MYLEAQAKNCCSEQSYKKADVPLILSYMLMDMGNNVVFGLSPES